MLVYVRESDWDRIMCEPTMMDLQESLRVRFAVRAGTEGRGMGGEGGGVGGRGAKGEGHEPTSRR